MSPATTPTGRTHSLTHLWQSYLANTPGLDSQDGIADHLGLPAHMLTPWGVPNRPTVAPSVFALAGLIDTPDLTDQLITGHHQSAEPLPTIPFGKILRAHLDTNGITPSQFANQFGGVTSTAVRKWLHQDTTPAARTASRLFRLPTIGPTLLNAHLAEWATRNPAVHPGARWLRAIRQAAGHSYRDAGRFTNVSIMQWGTFEHGKQPVHNTIRLALNYLRAIPKEDHHTTPHPLFLPGDPIWAAILTANTTTQAILLWHND